MKKLMIGILVIIPLIVMLTVGLISRYVSQKVHIGVDSVSFSTDTLSVNLSDFTQDADGNFTIDLAALLEPEVLPSHAAAANSLEWSIEDVEPTADELGGIPAATLPDASKGTVVVSTYCSFFVIAQAEQASARCYVEITDKEVQSVTLYSPSGSVAVGGSVKLTPQYTPLNSIVTQGSWSTGDPSVATVDANGVVTGKAAGSAVITFVTHTDGGAKEVRATYTITVTAAATVFGDKFYSHLTDIALSDILAPGVSAEGASAVGGSISGGVLSLDSDECTVTLSSGEKTFTVIRCGVDDITILNKDIFAYDSEAEDPFVVATDEIPLDLDAAYLSAFRAGRGRLWAAPGIGLSCGVFVENLRRISRVGDVGKCSAGAPEKLGDTGLSPALTRGGRGDEGKKGRGRSEEKGGTFRGEGVLCGNKCYIRGKQ